MSCYRIWGRTDWWYQRR